MLEPTKPTEDEVRSCLKCRHHSFHIESGEIQHVGDHECRVRPHNATLRQFPFRNTRCDRWEMRA